MRDGGRAAVKIKRYLPARESRDAYIICTSGGTLSMRNKSGCEIDGDLNRLSLISISFRNTEISKGIFNPVIYALACSIVKNGIGSAYFFFRCASVYVLRRVKIRHFNAT